MTPEPRWRCNADTLKGRRCEKATVNFGIFNMGYCRQHFNLLVAGRLKFDDSNPNRRPSVVDRSKSAP